MRSSAKSTTFWVASWTRLKSQQMKNSPRKPSSTTMMTEESTTWAKKNFLNALSSRKAIQRYFLEKNAQNQFSGANIEYSEEHKSHIRKTKSQKDHSLPSHRSNYRRNHQIKTNTHVFCHTFSIPKIHLNAHYHETYVKLFLQQNGISDPQ